MMGIFKEQYKMVLAVLIIVIISTGVFCYYGYEKEIIFCDEVYSYTIVNNDIGLKIKDNKWYEQDEIESQMSSSSGTFGYDDVIETTGEDVHPPMYYLILKTFSMIFPQSTSKWIGFAANYIIFIPMLILVCFTSLKIMNKPWCIAAFTILFAIHSSVQGCALLIRMYFHLTFWLLCFVILTKQIAEGKENWRIYLMLGMITFLGFMTQYYFAVYVAIFSFLWGIDRILNKRWKSLLVYLGTMISAVVVSMLYFPQWIEHIFHGYKGKASFQKLSNWENYFEDLKKVFEIVGEFVVTDHAILGWCILLISTVFFLSLKNSKLKDIKKYYSMNIITQLLYYCVIARVMPGIESRYFWSVIIVQMVFVLWMLLHIIKHYQLCNKKIFSILILAMTITFVVTVPNRKNEVSYNGIKYREGRIEVEKYSSIPWIYYGDRDWKMHCAAFDYLIPEQIMFIRDLSTLVYDEILQNSSSFLVYSKTEEEILEFETVIKEISGLDYTYELVAKRPYNYAFLFKLW